MGRSPFNTSVLKRRWLVRGESLVASTGLALAAVVLLAVGGATWWSIREFGRVSGERTETEARRLTTLVAGAVEPLLAAGEVTAVRRIVMEAARGERVRGCRVLMPDGRVLADSDPGRIDVESLPDTWGGEVGEAAEMESGEGRFVTIRQPLVAAGRGAVLCEFELERLPEDGGVAAVRAGAVVSGSVGLGLLLLLYRRFRARMGAMGAVREALLAMTLGEAEHEALVVAETFGPEARAWNLLLGEREELRRRDLRDRAEAVTSARGVGGGDRGVCDLLTDGVVLVNERGEVTYANGAAAVLVGTAVGSMVGAPLGGVLSGEAVLGAVREAIATGSRRRVGLDVTGEGGEDGEGVSVLRVNVRGVRGIEGAAAMLTVEDVTQQRLADESRNAFVAQATHELRTPLTNIRLYVEQALDDGDNDAALRSRALNVINQEARRLERIVGDMLSVSEIEAGAMALRVDDVRLDQLFGQVEEDYKAQAIEKNIGLAFELPPKLPVIRGDRDKLCLALHNLVGNALKYTPKGGHVHVRVRVGADDSVAVDVIDTGIGISEADQAKVFEKFYRAKDSRLETVAGSGIGLSLAREIARLHQGEITLESELNKGSTFTLSLPAPVRAARAA